MKSFIYPIRMSKYVDARGFSLTTSKMISDTILCANARPYTIFVWRVAVAHGRTLSSLEYFHWLCIPDSPIRSPSSSEENVLSAFELESQLLFRVGYEYVG